MITSKQLKALSKDYPHFENVDMKSQKAIRSNIGTYIFDHSGTDDLFHRRFGDGQWKKWRKIFSEKDLLLILDSYFDGQHDT